MLNYFVYILIVSCICYLLCIETLCFMMFDFFFFLLLVENLTIRPVLISIIGVSWGLGMGCLGLMLLSVGSVGI